MQYKRGQGATEYLVILGAVLLVALVIVSLLGWFPSLGGATKEQQSKAYWTGTSPFAITTYRINGTGITLLLANRLGEKLNLTNISVQDGFGSDVSIATPNAFFNAGEEEVVSNTTSLGNPCVGKAAGSSFEFKVVAFTYNQGTITGIRQQGAQALVGRCS